jgi:Anti-sigma-K factor rskA/Putative zinc-finger
MSHEEASELLGAYALDAVEEDEHEELEDHLATCPRCRAELDSLREVAGLMGNSVVSLPEGLWSNIVSSLPPRQDEEPPPMPQLVLEPRQQPEPSRRPGATRVAMATVGAIAVAAAAVAVVLGVDLVRADRQVSSLQATMSAHPPQSVAQALKTPGHRIVTMETAFHLPVAEFVLVPDGRGFLVNSRLPVLPGSHTYQLWAIVGSRPISLGVLGQAPGPASFTMAGASNASQLAITEEPSGGSVVPTLPIIATARV